MHVAGYIEGLAGELAKPTVKQHLAALRMLFDWLVVGHVLDSNPAHAVRGPSHVVKKGRTPVLDREEARALLAAIDTGSVTGLRDRALIGTMIYTFARVGAVLQMNVGDYFIQGRRGWVRFHEKGGQEHEAPCHHKLESFLDEYIAAAGIADDTDGPLFRTTGRATGKPHRMTQPDAYRMIQRRAKAAGIKTKIGNHSLRATGITDYLKNNGTLEHAQTMANHSSPRTTKLYDRRSDEISLDEYERVGI
jgi:integrase